MANFPTDTFTGDGGDLDVFIPAKWGSKINDFAKEALKITRHCTDRSDELVDGGNIVYTPGLTEMSSYEKTTGSAVTLSSPEETSVTLTVNNWYHVAFMIEDEEKATYKKSYYLQERYAENAGYTTGNLLEDALIDLFPSFTNSAGSSTSTITDSTILSAIGQIESATKEDVDNGNFVFAFETKVFWNQVAAIDTYQLNTNSPSNDPVGHRPLPRLYGVPVVTSSRLDYISGTDGRYNALIHKDALHFATAKLPGQGSGLVRTMTNYVPQYQGFLTVTDILYGVTMNRATYGIKILSSAS